MLKIWTQRNRNIRCFEQDQHASSSVPETMHTNWPFCNLWLITVDCWTKMQRFCCHAQHILHFISLAMNLLHYLLQHINRMDLNMYVLSPCHKKRKSFDIYLSVFNPNLNPTSRNSSSKHDCAICLTMSHGKLSTIVII